MSPNVMSSEADQTRGFAERPQSTFVFDDSRSSEIREFNVRDVFGFLWGGKSYIVVGALFLTLAALLYIALYTLAVPRLTAYRSSVTVTMVGAEPGLYPNGMAFAPSDLRAPAVLEAVFDANDLSKFGLDLATFANMVSVETYSPVFDATVERFRARLDSKTLTFEERKSIEEEFSTAIASITGKGLLVTFSVPQNKNIGDVAAAKVVNDIPVKWADVFINRLGAVNLPVEVSGEDLVDDRLLKDLDYPMVYDYIIGQFDKLDMRIKSIEAIPGVSTILSKSTGKSISDIRRELESIGRFRLDLGLRPFVDMGLSREKDIASIVYENLSKSLELQDLANQDSARDITTVLNDFRSKNNVTVGNPGQPVSANGGFSQGAVTQIDGTTVDKIIELAKSGEGLDFQKELLDKKLDAVTKSSKVANERRKLVLRLAALQPNSANSYDMARITKEFENKSMVAAKDLNDLWNESNQFLDEINMKRLNFDKKLYASSDLSTAMRITRPDWLSTRRLLLISLAAIMGALAGLSIYSVRKFLAGTRWRPV